MKLTAREVDKLVFVLNRVVEKHGYNANTEGFSYDDDLNIFVKDGRDGAIRFECGLDFLIDEFEIRDIEEEQKKGEEIWKHML